MLLLNNILQLPITVQKINVTDIPGISKFSIWLLGMAIMGDNATRSMRLVNAQKGI
jgi:hypothetical protein